MKKTASLFFVLFAFALVTNSCSKPPTSYAPESISGYTISFYSSKLTEPDQTYLHKNALYSFDHGSNYTIILDGKIRVKGDYSYRKISPNSARLLVSYSNYHTLGDYLITLDYSGPTNGSWTGSYTDDKNSNEEGTFEIKKQDLAR